MSLRATTPRLRAVTMLVQPASLARSRSTSLIASRYVRASMLAQHVTPLDRLATTPHLGSALATPSLLASSRLFTTSTRNYSPTSSASARSASPTQSNPNSSSSSNSRPETNTESDPDPEPELEPEPAPNASAYTRFKALSKKYGWWAVGVYLLLSSIDFSLTFLLVHSLGAERIEPVFDSGKHLYRVQRYGEEEADRLRAEDEKTREEERNQERLEGGGNKQKKSGGGIMGKTFWAEVVLAYTIHKTALLPLRAGLTVAWTPKLVGWLTKRGWVGKGGLTRAASHAQGKVRDASDRVKVASDRVKERVKRQP
ncbi:hypothetical protein IAR55_004671 [Kwoniella newhampshirensis]|uniref:DUF1279 domain-containing protein n=1 Tax=Kwoniella newhampshirensis TaxID=1651941 RepID=A0AAW0YQ32_9TREE